MSCATSAFGGVVELDVVGLRPADDRFLLLGAEPLPRREGVQVLLHDQVAAAREGGILVADEDGVGEVGPDRVGRAVDEAEEIAVVEVAEPGDLVATVTVVPSAASRSRSSS